MYMCKRMSVYNELSELVYYGDNEIYYVISINIIITTNKSTIEKMSNTPVIHTRTHVAKHTYIK